MRLTPIPPSGTQLVEILGVGQREIETWTPTEQGQRLRARRLELKLGLLTPSARACIRPSEWSAIEFGRASVSDEDFERLLAALEQSGGE